MNQDFETIELGVWDGAGKPLHAHAPTSLQRATVAIKRAIPQATPPPWTDEERLASALGALAARECRTAENLLHRRSPVPIHATTSGSSSGRLLAKPW